MRLEVLAGSINVYGRVQTLGSLYLGVLLGGMCGESVGNLCPRRVSFMPAMSAREKPCDVHACGLAPPLPADGKASEQARGCAASFA